MANICRIGDTGDGICDPPGDDPHASTGQILNGAGSVYSDGINVARIGDIVQSSCNHGTYGTIVSGAATVYGEGINVARIGDYFDGNFSGTLIDGSPTVYAE